MKKLIGKKLIRRWFSNRSKLLKQNQFFFSQEKRDWQEEFRKYANKFQQEYQRNRRNWLFLGGFLLTGFGLFWISQIPQQITEEEMFAMLSDRGVDRLYFKNLDKNNKTNNAVLKFSCQQKKY